MTHHPLHLNLNASAEEWRAAVTAVRPSRLLGRMAPSISGGGSDTASGWRRIHGHASIKRRLEQLVLWPLRQPQTAQRLGLLGGSHGVLLYGPPGTGKTLLVRALAEEAAVSLISVPMAALIQSTVGASERR